MKNYKSLKAIIEIAKQYATESNYQFVGIASYWVEGQGEIDAVYATTKNVSRMKRVIKQALTAGAKRISFIMYEGTRKATVDFPTSRFKK